jgi:hypothetical protein
VASRLPSPFQSSVVTSLLCLLSSVVWCSTSDRGGCDVAPGCQSVLRSQIRAVESPDLAGGEALEHERCGGLSHLNKETESCWLPSSSSSDWRFPGAIQRGRPLP